MQLEECFRRVTRYLNNSDDRPRFVNLQNARDLAAFCQHFSVEGNFFRTPADYSAPDEDLRLESLYDELNRLQGKAFLRGFTTQLKLYGFNAVERFLQTLAEMTSPIHKLVVICFQCSELLDFHDQRKNQLIYAVDGVPDANPWLCLLGEDFSVPSGSVVASGIQFAALQLEATSTGVAYVRTSKGKRSYPHSMIPLKEQRSFFDALCDIDPSTRELRAAMGTQEQWQQAYQEMQSAGGWHQLFAQKLRTTSALDLDAVVGNWSRFDDYQKWLFFLALKLLGAPQNWCLQKAVTRSETVDDLRRQVYRCLLDEDWRSDDFLQHYQERKSLLDCMSNYDDDAEVLDYIGMTHMHGIDGIRYLTDATQPERERILEILSHDGNQFSRSELIKILEVVYKDLASYLSAYSFPGCEWLNSYFEEYRYSKVCNYISAPLMELMQKQAIDRDFFKLPARSSAFNAIDKEGAFLYYIDAMGVEYLGYILCKCKEYDLIAHVTICHAELPTLTFCNKEFFDGFAGQKIKVRELDEIKHHGAENYDYLQTKLPLHLIRELEILDDVLRKAKAKLMRNMNSKVLLAADHGGTRMAVIHGKMLNQDYSFHGSHYGRVCTFEEGMPRVPAAAREGDYYVLASYDRFDGGRMPSVEAHGGATLEEAVVPIVELSMRPTNLEIFIMDNVVEYSYKQKPVLTLFSKTPLNNMDILVRGSTGDGVRYTAQPSRDGQTFDFVMPEVRRGTYSVSVYVDGNEVSSGLKFTAKSKAAGFNNKGGIL